MLAFVAYSTRSGDVAILPLKLVTSPNMGVKGKIPTSPFDVRSRDVWHDVSGVWLWTSKQLVLDHFDVSMDSAHDGGVDNAVLASGNPARRSQDSSVFAQHRDQSQEKLSGTDCYPWRHSVFCNSATVHSGFFLPSQSCRPPCMMSWCPQLVQPISSGTRDGFPVFLSIFTSTRRSHCATRNRILSHIVEMGRWRSLRVARVYLSEVADVLRESVMSSCLRDHLSELTRELYRRCDNETWTFLLKTAHIYTCENKRADSIESVSSILTL